MSNIAPSSASANYFREFLFERPPADASVLLANAAVLDSMPMADNQTPPQLAEFLGQLPEDAFEAARVVAPRTLKVLPRSRKRIPSTVRPYSADYPLTVAIDTLTDSMNPVEKPMEFLCMHILALKNIQRDAEKPEHVTNALIPIEEWAFLLRGRANEHYAILQEWIADMRASGYDNAPTGVE